MGTIMAETTNLFQDDESNTAHLFLCIERPFLYTENTFYEYFNTYFNMILTRFEQKTHKSLVL